MRHKVISFFTSQLALLPILCWISTSEAKGIPTSSFSPSLPGKYEESQNQMLHQENRPQLQFEIPTSSQVQVPGLASLGVASSPSPSSTGSLATQPQLQPPPPLLQTVSTPTTINLLNQAINLGEGESSNWEISDVSIEGADASLDVVNDGFSSLAQWAQTLQETDFVQLPEEDIGLVSLVEVHQEDEEEEEKDLEVEHPPKNNSNPTILDLPGLAVPLAPLQPMQIYLPPPSPPAQEVERPPTVEVEFIPAPEPEPEVTLVEYLPLSEYGWYPPPSHTNTVGGSQNTGGSQTMSMNLSGNVMDVTGSQNVNVMVHTHGTGGTSSVQVLGQGRKAPLGLDKPQSSQAGKPNRVTIQLRAPPPGKALIHQQVFGGEKKGSFSVSIN